MRRKIIHNNFFLRTWIEINRSALKHNYNIFRKLCPQSQLMAIVKSNAYGHGLLDYAQAVSQLGIDWLGVDSLIEGVKLRQQGIKKPILVLGYTLPEMVKFAIRKKISLSCSSWDSLNYLQAQKIKNLKIHLKFDTGMSRQGFNTQEAEQVFNFVQQKLPGVIIEGIFTHFAGAKNPQYPDFTEQQIQSFEQVLQIAQDKQITALRHASATSGALIFPQAHFDLVRIGIGLYGHWPSLEIEKEYAPKINLQPLLTWKTVIGELKTISAGSKVGYDATAQVEQDTKIAILPVGYWHGYDRSLSNQSYVIIKGERAKVLGRISMDMIIVDVSNIKDIQVGDEVSLINNNFTAEEMAELAQTSSYEILTRLNPLIKRVYI